MKAKLVLAMALLVSIFLPEASFSQEIYPVRRQCRIVCDDYVPVPRRQRVVVRYLQFEVFEVNPWYGVVRRVVSVPVVVVEEVK